MESLLAWNNHSEPGVRYFSGTATYTYRFARPTAAIREGPLLLDLGEVCDVAVVRVNGKQAGTLWKAPFRIEISALVKAGENRLEVEIVNQWNNRLVGDSQLAVDQRITRSNLAGKFSAVSPLLRSGLLGPVTLRQGAYVTTPWR